VFRQLEMLVERDNKMSNLSGKTQPEKPEILETELSELDLEQVSGGFNPQPDPPGRANLNKISFGLLLPAVRVAYKI
jgi:hypothetical protein